MPESLGAAANLSLLFVVSSSHVLLIMINDDQLGCLADLAFVYCWSSIGPYVDHGHKETVTGLGARDTASGSQRTAQSYYRSRGLPGCSMSSHHSLPKDHIPQKGDMIQEHLATVMTFMVSATSLPVLARLFSVESPSAMFSCLQGRALRCFSTTRSYLCLRRALTSE